MKSKRLAKLYNLIIVLVILVLAVSCASFQNKDKKTLLLEEIEKENAPQGEEVDAKHLWENAKIEKRWVPAHYRGNRVYVPGHFEYVVTTPGQWKTK